MPLPAISKAVPWSTEVRRKGKPSATLTLVLDTVHFDGNMSLVVIHYQHDVKFPFDGRLKMESAGNGPRASIAQSDRVLGRPGNFFDFFPAEHPVFPGVRVQRRHADYRLAETPLTERFIG